MSNGVTLTVGDDEDICISGESGKSLDELYTYLTNEMTSSNNIEFDVIINHVLDEDVVQKVRHKYFIPCEKVTWFMVEKV